MNEGEQGEEGRDEPRGWGRLCQTEPKAQLACLFSRCKCCIVQQCIAGSRRRITSRLTNLMKARLEAYSIPALTRPKTALRSRLFAGQNNEHQVIFSMLQISDLTMADLSSSSKPQRSEVESELDQIYARRLLPIPTPNSDHVSASVNFLYREHRV
jgi:hypothetical protein